jgi:hypothetical protein
MRYPKLEFVRTYWAYIDQTAPENIMEKEYTREAAMQFLPRWVERGTRLTSDTELLPRPSKPNCGYCDYKEPCEWSAV